MKARTALCNLKAAGIINTSEKEVMQLRALKELGKTNLRGAQRAHEGGAASCKDVWGINKQDEEARGNNLEGQHKAENA